MKIEAEIKSFSIVFLLSVFLIILSFDVSGQKKSDSEIVITIERTACFGSCPVYSAQVYSDGTVIYEGKDFVKVSGRKEHKISVENVKKLIKEFEDADYFSLKEEYQTDENGMSYTDQPTTTTSISVNDKHKKVVNYLGAPKKLRELEDKIDKIADLYKYIGPA